jgi:hypothetical protein
MAFRGLLCRDERYRDIRPCYAGDAKQGVEDSKISRMS